MYKRVTPQEDGSRLYPGKISHRKMRTASPWLRLCFRQAAGVFVEYPHRGVTNGGFLSPSEPSPPGSALRPSIFTFAFSWCPVSRRKLRRQKLSPALGLGRVHHSQSPQSRCLAYDGRPTVACGAAATSIDSSGRITLVYAAGRRAAGAAENFRPESSGGRVNVVFGCGDLWYATGSPGRVINLGRSR